MIMGTVDPPAADAPEERILSLDEAVVYASALHRQGRLDDAEEVYRQVMAARDDHPDCLHFLGVLMHQRGDHGAAETLIRRSIALVDKPSGQWNNLGNVFMETGRVDDALECYEQSLRVHPEGVEAWSNLSTLYRAKGRITDAVNAACRVITLDPHHVGARRLLGYAYALLGELEKAVQVYRDWLAEEPDNPIARHLLAACSEGTAPERASDAFVQSVFDAFADSFDEKLEQLDYKAPHFVAEALGRALAGQRGDLHILDAGCGTGLCGPLVRPLAARLSGVDLSAAMLDKARQRGCYDILKVAELCCCLEALPDTFDAVISADTLCYFGELGPVARAAAAALRGDGPFIFTVEALDDEGAVPGYRLAPHGRYAHAAAYVRQTLIQGGFAPPCLEQVILRREGGVPVHGWLVSAQRAVLPTVLSP